MTEQEWLNSTDPEPMIEFLRGKAAERKFRLFAAGCCRHTCLWVTSEWKRMVDRGKDPVEIKLIKWEAELACKAVDLAERVADGLTNVSELKKLFYSFGDEDFHECFGGGTDAAWSAQASADRARWCATYYGFFSYPQGPGGRCPSQPDYEKEQAAQCNLLRDIFGNPFRTAAVDSTWLNLDVVKLAQAIYDDRAFDRLPLLADALEKIGCTNVDILTHCRRPSEHVRGCWVVDLLLGK